MAVAVSMAQQIVQAQGGIGAAELLTPADVARRLGVPEPDALALIESGDLPSKKIGASYRVKRSHLDEYLNR
jgi:excisionase family DNA binding protein